jgi:PAS domain S-box-containing protein
VSEEIQRIAELEERVRELEDELRAVRDRHFRAAEAGGVGVWEWDLQTGRVHVDVGWRRHFGYQESEIGDRVEDWQRHVHPDDGLLRQEALRRCLDDPDRPYEVEFRVIAADGGTRWVRALGRVIRDERGRPVRVTGADTDVTARRTAEQVLRQRTELAQRIARSIPHLVFVWDVRHRRTVYANHPFGEFLGYDASDTRWSDVMPLHPEDRARFGDMVSRWADVSDDDVLESEYRVRDANGEWRSMQARSVVFRRAEDGSVQEILGTATDVTDQRRAEEERRALQVQQARAARVEMVATLAAGIAHDMNNVLGVTLGQGQLGLQLDPEPELRESFEEIVEASRRGRDIVDRVLRVTRQPSRDRRPLVPRAALVDSLELLGPLLPSSVRVVRRLEETGPVDMDPTQLYQVLVNLCSNAAQAMGEEGGTLTVGLREIEPDDARRQVEIEVRDTGPGVESEHLERIFDPFFTTKPVGEGTGLGLAIVDGIVRSHGGRIDVESAPGRGTAFRILLPRVEGAPASRREGQPVVGMVRGEGRVLFVDDEPSVVRAGRGLIETLGYRAEGFTDPEEALAAFTANPAGWDLLVTDENMPGLRGHELARRVVRKKPGLPVVICTGRAEVPAFDPVRHGVVEVVRKPLLLEELGPVLARALGAPARDGSGGAR